MQYASDAGLRFEVRCRAVVHGGSAAADTDGLRVDAADEVILLLAAATGYDGFENSRAGRYRDPAPVVLGTLDAATRDTWESLRRAHESDHAAIMSRVTLDLGASTSPATATTVERIAKSGASDPQLVALLFAYGRYLLAASSRPGTQPANLQGIWNDMVRPPWSSNYTTNINAEMNYWPAESANLADMHGPLLDFIGEVAVTRREDRPDQLRREGLDRPPQLGSLAAVRARRQLRRRRPGLGVLADGRPVARPASLDALRLRR